jgi:hypothetical protein
MKWLQNLVVKIAARKAAKALDLQEGTPMENSKPWYKSKGVITGLVTVLISTYEAVKVTVAPQVGWNLPDIPAIAYTILGALGIYSRVAANSTVTK